MRSAIRIISVCAAALAASLAPAQNITGTITGVVEDATGAAVPGASIVAVNTATAMAYKSNTNEAGVYVLPLLPPGSYQVSVEASGFKRFVRAGLSLGSDDRLRVDARIEIGALSEQITVTGGAPLVKTDQATLGGSFSPSQFESLPIGRESVSVMRLVPGVQPSAATGPETFRLGQALASGNINGARDVAADYKVDGASAGNTNNNLVTLSPINEMVEEVVIQTAAYSAEFGHGSTQINLTTRAGTSQYHGALLHYFQNDALNATDFMNNVYGTDKPVWRYNLFGATLGGPVPILKTHSSRGTFFNLGYEGIRLRLFEQAVSSVPTAAMRAGDFQGQSMIYDPGTTRPGPAGAGFVRDPFTGNIVPATRMDPVALKMQEVAYPVPTQAGTADNYVNSGPGSLTEDAINTRADHQFNDNNRLTVRFSQRRSLRQQVMRFPGPAGSGTDAGNTLHKNVTSRVISAAYTSIFRPNLINNLHFGLYYYKNDAFGPAADEGWAGQLGLKNLAPDTFPQVGITGLNSFGGAANNKKIPGSNLQFTDGLVWVRGQHSVKVGGEYRTLGSSSRVAGASSGNFTFNTLPTMNPQTQRLGIGYASFLLGIPSRTNVALVPKTPFGIRWKYLGGYIQDDYRATNKLTINLGLRWEMTTPRKEVDNRQSNFNLGTLEMDYAGRNGYPETLYDYNWRDFAPRFGFVYSPFPKNNTVIRGGYGIFFVPGTNIGDNPFTTGPWSRAYTYVSPDNGITFPFTLRQSPPAMSFDEPYVLSPLTAQAWLPRDYPDGYMQQWSLNIQREIVPGTVVEAGYVGTRGLHLQMNYQLNQVPRELLGPGNAQLRRPYPTRGDISAQFIPVSSSNYHALQVRFERRLARGLAYQGSYTFSKSIDDASGFAARAWGFTSVQDNANLRAERSVSGFDLTHNLGYSVVYELPAGKGRKVLNQGGLLSAVLGGWNASFLSTLRGGRPLVMGTVSNLTGSLGGGSRPNRLADGKLSGAERGRLRWFDTSAYAVPAAFTFGNTSRTEPGVRGPGEFNFDLLLSKEFRFQETKRLQIRSEFLNGLNHFNPGDPNTTIGHAAQGTITTGSSGRSVVLALKFHF